MDIIKTAGNICSLLMMFIFISTSAEVTLRVVNERSIPLQAIQVGRPFVIEVAVTGNSSQQVPEIEGLEPFAIQEKGWGYQNINGRTTITHNLTAIANEPGTFTIGPATVAHETSNSITITVGERELNDEYADGEEEHSFMLRLSVDKKNAVKGERLVARLHLYYPHTMPLLRNLIEQESNAFMRKKARGPIQGIELIDGVHYSFLEWNWDMYPQKTGSLMIPAFGAEYEQEQKRDHLWGGLGRLFGAHRELKRIYSNAVSVDVQDLPASSKPIQGIGTFDSFILSASPAAARQGEGIVVTMQLKGNANPDMVQLAGLQGIPDELRSYESQQFIEEPASADGMMCKRYEYIIQGLKTGSWQIPVQQFYFYDTHDHIFKTIQTAPLTVTIMPGTIKQSAPFDSTNDSSQPLNHLSITTDYCEPAYHYAMLPWWFFLIAVAVPFLIWMFQKGHTSFSAHQQKNYRARRAQNACAHAMKQLKKLQHKQRPELLYTLFIQLFADRWQLPVSSITQELIVHRLSDVGMNAEQLDRWKLFFENSAALAFGGAGSKKQIENLFTQAESWIEELQQLL